MQSLYKKHAQWAAKLEPIWYKLVKGIERRRAIRNRDKFTPSVIGVTGSCGKSTTTRLISHVLQKAYGENVFERGVDNTQRAVYKSFRKLQHSGKTLVQEISGGGGDGYLEYLLEDVPLDVAVITSIGSEHIKLFSSIDAITQEKFKVVRALQPGGFACLNIDDERLAAQANAMPEGRKLITFGQHQDADVRAEVITSDWRDRLSFHLLVDQRSYVVKTQFVGTLMLTNILAALAVVVGKGFAVQPAIDAIASAEPVQNHLSLEVAQNGRTFLMDAFKAPLWSTKMLIEDLAKIKSGRLVLVLGQLSETGSGGSVRYRQTIRAAQPHCDLIIGIGGAQSSATKINAREPEGNVVACETVEDIQRTIAEYDDALVVVKSSKLAKLWRLFEINNEPISCNVMPCRLQVGCAHCPLLRA